MDHIKSRLHTLRAHLSELYIDNPTSPIQTEPSSCYAYLRHLAQDEKRTGRRKQVWEMWNERDGVTSAGKPSPPPAAAAPAVDSSEDAGDVQSVPSSPPPQAQPLKSNPTPTAGKRTTRTTRGGPVCSPDVEPLNIVIIGTSFAGLSVAHAFLDTVRAQLNASPAVPPYRLVLISPSERIYWNIGAPRALVNGEMLTEEELFVPIEEGFRRHLAARFPGLAERMDAEGIEVSELNDNGKEKGWVYLQCDANWIDPEERYVEIHNTTKDAVIRSRGVAPSDSWPDGAEEEYGWREEIDDEFCNYWAYGGIRVPYHALIIASGSQAASRLLSLPEGANWTFTAKALRKFHEKVAKARSILVAGGGTSGVETAAQLATFLNWRGKKFFPLLRTMVKEPKTITLVTGGERCLQQLSPEISARAEKKLKKLGVQVRHHIRVTQTRESSNGVTEVLFDDGTYTPVDAYIPCTGVKPNTNFAKRWRDEHGYIKTEVAADDKGTTLRVAGAGPRVYAIGDCASYSLNYVYDVYPAVPVLMQNLLSDLQAHELALASPYGGNNDAIAALKAADVYYKSKGQAAGPEAILCPMSRFGGVGVIAGLRIPSFLVYLMKGRHYKITRAQDVVVNGGNPYASVGQSKWGN